MYHLWRRGCAGRPEAHQQKSMGHTGKGVPSHDVAAGIDRSRPGKGSIGEIKTAELAPA